MPHYYAILHDTKRHVTYGYVFRDRSIHAAKVHCWHEIGPQMDATPDGVWRVNREFFLDHIDYRTPKQLKTED